MLEPPDLDQIGLKRRTFNMLMKRAVHWRDGLPIEIPRTINALVVVPLAEFLKIKGFGLLSLLDLTLCLQRHGYELDGAMVFLRQVAVNRGPASPIAQALKTRAKKVKR